MSPSQQMSNNEGNQSNSQTTDSGLYPYKYEENDIQKNLKIRPNYTISNSSSGNRKSVLIAVILIILVGITMIGLTVERAVIGILLEVFCISATTAFLHFLYNNLSLIKPIKLFRLRVSFTVWWVTAIVIVTYQFWAGNQSMPDIFRFPFWMTVVLVVFHISLYLFFRITNTSGQPSAPKDASIEFQSFPYERGFQQERGSHPRPWHQ